MKIQAKIRTFLAENLVTLRRAPVEMAIAAYLFVIGVLAQHHVFPYSGEQLLAGPIVLLLTFLCNKWFAKGWLRALYYLSGLAVIPFRWADMGEWIENPAYYVTIIIGLLAGLLCSWHKDNRRFTENLLRYVWDGISALFLTGVAYLLLLAIFFSIVYIFGIFKGITSDFCADAALLFFIVLWPLVFLTFNRKSEPAEPESSKLLDTLLNWVLSPAVLAYTVLLYLYFAKIVATWSLPRGGIAYLVFGFTLIAVAAQAGQTLLNKRYYDWFYNRFSLISLPTQLLFWVGAIRRTSEYGLTSPRIYLLVCGGLMTLCVVLFLFRRAGRYMYVCLTAFAVFAAFAYVPSLEPERLAVRSQVGRAVRIAESLGRLGDDGRLILTPVPPADSVYREAYHGLYESLKFVERRDTAVFARFGTDLDGFAAIFPERMRSYVRWGYDYCNSYCVNNIIELEAPVNARFEVNAEYPHYYMNLRGWSDSSYHFGGDTLRLFLGEERAVHRIPCRELLERQLKESGFEPSEGCEPTSDQLLRLLDYRDDRCRILFENIRLERTDSAVVIQGMSINAVLMR